MKQLKEELKKAFSKESLTFFFKEEIWNPFTKVFPIVVAFLLGGKYA